MTNVYRLTQSKQRKLIFPRNSEDIHSSLDGSPKKNLNGNLDKVAQASKSRSTYSYWVSLEENWQFGIFRHFRSIGGVWTHFLLFHPFSRQVSTPAKVAAAQKCTLQALKLTRFSRVPRQIILPLTFTKCAQIPSSVFKTFVNSGSRSRPVSSW